MKHRNKKGFTIMELVIVIAIVAVLAAVLIPTFAGLIKKANNSAYEQERTNQLINDAVEKIDNTNWLSFEDFEKALAEGLAKAGNEQEKVKDAVKAALEEYTAKNIGSNSGLTESQIRTIIERSLSGQLTKTQVESIIRSALNNLESGINQEQIKKIVADAVKDLDNTSISLEDVQAAIAAAIAASDFADDDTVKTAIADALKGFNTMSEDDLKTLINDAIASVESDKIVVSEDEIASETYTVAADDADKTIYIVTDSYRAKLDVKDSTADTKIIIDAPNINELTVNGPANVMRIFRTAGSSTHVKGNVGILNINSGRVVIENGAKVGQLTAAPAMRAVVTVDITEGTEVAKLYAEYQYYEGTNDYIVINNEGTVTNAYMTASPAVSSESTTNVVINNGENGQGTKAEELAVSYKGSNLSTNLVVDGTTYVVSDENGITLFAGGNGTKENPYLIVDYDTFQNVSKLYDEGYYYFKVKDGIKTISLLNNKYVSLNGSLDGNGVIFTHVNGGMFGAVGTYDSDDTKAVVLKNFTVQNEGGWGIVSECGATTLEFNNISVTGYSLHNWNAGEFLRYGSGEGFNYTVNFINCSCNAEIYSTNNAWSTILVGHTYPGGSAISTINVDAYTDEHINDSILYYTGNGTPEGHKYYGMGNVKVYVDGIEKNATDNKKVNNIVRVDSTKNPAKSESGYSISTQSDTSKVVVTLLWQYTEWENNYSSKIADLSGVGGTIGKTITFETTGLTDLEIFDSITSVEIRTSSDKWDYELDNGKLVLYMTNTNTYIDGNVTLFVEQFTSSSNIAKYKGSLLIASKTKDAEWVIK